MVQKRGMRRAVIATLASCAVLVSACGGDNETAAGGGGGGDSASGEPIKVASVQTLSGPAAQTGEPQRDGVKMAVEEINANGGIDGSPLEVEYIDDKGDPAKAVSEVQRLVQAGEVKAIIGTSLSAVTLAVQEITEEAQIPLLDAFAGSDEIIGPEKQFTFRVTGPISSELKRLHSYAVEQGVKRIAMLHGTDGWGLGGAAFKDSLAGDGVELVATVAHEVNTADFSTQIRKLRQADPDMIVQWNLGGDAAKFTKQVRAQGWNDVLLAGGRAFGYPIVFELAGKKAMDGAVRVDAFDETKAEAAEFLALYKEKYPTPKHQMDLIAQAYDAGMLLAEALRQGGTDSPEAVRDGFYAIQEHKGASGGEGSYFSYSADKHEGATGENYFNIKVAKDGEWVTPSN
jgi:branched-chain amino acid transport system substrate-binding protein